MKDGLPALGSDIEGLFTKHEARTNALVWFLVSHGVDFDLHGFSVKLSSIKSANGLTRILFILILNNGCAFGAAQTIPVNAADFQLSNLREDNLRR